MNKKAAILTAILFSGILSLYAVPPKWFEAPVVNQGPNLQQGLNDPVWQKALKIPFSKFENKPGHTKKYPTESYWLFGDGALYIGFKCVNPNSPKLWQSSKQPRDNSLLFRHECVEFFIGDIKGDLYYQIAIDTLGNLYDGKQFDKKWDGPQKHKVDIQEGYWTLVVEIPPEMLDTIWCPGSYITFDITRHGHKPDGSGRETMTLSPPGVHSPEDRLFLGSINASLLGTTIKKSIARFKNEYATVKFPKSITNKLEEFEIT